MPRARLLSVALLPGLLSAQQPVPARTDIADGIYLFQAAPYSDVGLDGNAVVIVGDNGVLVFDANGTPAAAAAVLAGIRGVTKQPVRWLVLSHWHWDPWYGAQVYADSFPGLRIIGHEVSRRLMTGPAREFNRPGLETQLPGHIAAVAAGSRGSGIPRPGRRTCRGWSATSRPTASSWSRSAASATPCPTPPIATRSPFTWARAR